ncbi:TetR/AcrR family transcriptional regulator C-terminal domain-containing protein [Microbacterium trichothecenolyticum]|uniref:TetR/AcrR family transcriptional regulator n=1 Tax=Microbacterium trichothecenolyticum TaxID=69370 RepID=UPI001C6E1610|nr:TetR/AcrR family transcriptional regulator [Microbacterium trichothecenolyticum]MBW9121938.1 TetR/AcrR family transcriptional regulator C-terminal domain-containing protein [Microbacterium trichothecenolyticum]
MPRKPKGSEQLSLDAIVLAATAFVDEHGLDALTMRALADRMGVYPTALYWHVGSKSRLVSLAAARLFAQVTVRPDDGISWQAWLRSTAWAIRDAMHEHPNFAPVLGSQLAVDLSTATDYLEALLAVLGHAGFAGETLIHAGNAFNATVIGWVSVELSAEPAESGRDADWKQGFANRLEALPGQQYPTITGLLPGIANRAVMLRWDSGARNPLTASFEFTVEALIAGMQAMARAA